jgi:membrane protease YdiL (CAAX protease family)
LPPQNIYFRSQQIMTSELLNAIISTILQILLFSLIPFAFFLFRKDKSQTFLHYIGLYKPSGKSIAYVLVTVTLFLMVGLGMIFTDESVRESALAPMSVTGQLRRMGLSANTVAILLAIALFKTSFSEEIFFRGFIAKRLIYRLGFRAGNLLQALIFGLVHLLLFWLLTKAKLFPVLFIFSFSTAAGWVIGFIKEKYANGSIVPGWIAHGLGNALSYYVIAFVI